MPKKRRLDAKKVTYQKNQKKRKQYKARVRLFIVCFLVFAFFGVAILVSSLTKKPNTKSSSIPSSIPSSSSIIASPSPPVSSMPQKPQLPLAVGDFDEDGMPLLLNADNLIPETYKVTPVDVGGGKQMNERAAAAYSAMRKASQKENISLTPFSGYRSHEHQVTNYNKSINQYVANGKSKEEAERLTMEYYAVPGTSEHEAGLAMDIQSIQESFENTKDFAWLQENCAEYGFILRYPKNKQEITKIAYEPWHYRYIGANHAAKMKELKIETLEEYVEYFK